MALVLACRLLPFLVQPVTLFVCSAYSFFLNVAHFWPTIIKRCWTFEPQFLLSARQTRHGLSSNLVGHQHWIYWTVYVVGLSNLHGEYVVNGLGSSFHGKYICGLVVNLACCSQPGSRLMMLLLSGAHRISPPAGFPRSTLPACLPTLGSVMPSSAFAHAKLGWTLTIFAPWTVLATFSIIIP